MKNIRTTILIFILLFTFNIGMKGQVFNCFIANDTLISPTIYQFDIYLDATLSDFYFRSIQVGIQFDSAFFPAGSTTTGSIVPGTTQLNTYSVGPPQFNQTYHCFSVVSSAAGACLGNPAASNMLHFIPGMGPKRVSTYQITSTVPFNNSLPMPSMIRPMDQTPFLGILKMAVSCWTSNCIATTISNQGIYTNFSANTLINQIHDLSLYYPVIPNVIGEAYNDANGNCQHDSSEAPLSHINVGCIPGYYAQTNFNGSYYLLLPDGNYQLQYTTPLYWAATCSNNNITVSNGIANNNPDIGLMPIPGMNDLAIDFGLSSVRANRDVTVYIHYRNLGTTTLDGTIHFNMDTVFNYVGSSVIPDTIQPDFVSWNFTNMLPGEHRNLSLVLHSGMYPTGTMFSNSVIVSSPAGDVHLTDNSFSIRDSIRGSYDPNEKDVEPKGFGPGGAITPNDSLLNYRIAFQNTGNDTAFFVMVVDTLDENLDPLTFRIGATSSPCNYTLTNNILKFIFDPISLPDSTTDELNSHGLINFFIETMPNLPNGTVIENQAHIYFDYNLPVSTNTTINTIDYFLSNKEINSAEGTINVYPNPTNGYLRFELPDNKMVDGIAMLIDQTGRVLQRLVLHSENGAMNLSGYSPGVYTLNIVTEEHTIRSRIIVY